MKVIYLILVGTLLWSFIAAMLRLRRHYSGLAPILGWFLGLAFFILAPLTLMVLNGGYQMPAFLDVNDSYARVSFAQLGYLKPFLVIWISLFASFGAVILFTPQSDTELKRFERVFSQPMVRRVVLVTAGLAFIDYLLKIWMLGGVTDFFLSNWYDRQGDLVGRLGDPYVFYAWLSQANQLIFTAAGVLYTYCELKGRKTNWRFSLLVLLLFMVQIIMTGNRIFFALYLLSFGLSCWLLRRMKLVAFLLALAPALILVFSAWASFRSNLSQVGENIPGYFDNDLGNPTVTSLMSAFEGNDTMLLLHVINDFGSKYRFMYGASYLRAFVFWVPRKFYPDKPLGFSSQMAALYEPGVNTSLATTQLGELFANFGLFSVALLPILTICILLLSDKFAVDTNNRPLLVVVVFLLSIWVTRSAFDDALVTFVFVFPLLRVLRLERGLSRRTPVVRTAGYESA